MLVDIFYDFSKRYFGLRISLLIESLAVFLGLSKSEIFISTARPEGI